MKLRLPFVVALAAVSLLFAGRQAYRLDLAPVHEPPQLGPPAPPAPPPTPVVVRRPLAEPLRPEPGDAPADADVFGLGRVWHVHLDLSAEQFRAMKPVSGAFGFPPGPKPGPDGPHRNAFNVDLPRASGAVTVGGEKFDKVGVRYKGNGTILDTMDATKKSIKIELDRFDPKQRFRGLKTLNLHCGVTDPSRNREAMGYAVYRAAGVPAPRTAFAEVTLSVPGKFDREYLGLYTLVEPVDGKFLKQHYGSDKGLLMKPEGVTHPDYLGRNWASYPGRYHPRREATAAEGQRVVAFTRLVDRGADDDFHKQVGDYLDVDAFLRFTAVTALVANTDSLFALGHNYYLYLHPDTNKFHVVPWDLDRAFGNFGVYGSPDQLADLSLVESYGTPSRLTDRLLGHKPTMERYRAILKQAAAASFTKERLLKDLDVVEAATKKLVDKDRLAAESRGEPTGPPGGGFGPVADLRPFIDRRTKSVAAQLEGRSDGFVPTQWGRRPGSPPPAKRPPRAKL